MHGAGRAGLCSCRAARCATPAAGVSALSYQRAAPTAPVPHRHYFPYPPFLTARAKHMPHTARQTMADASRSNLDSDLLRVWGLVRARLHADLGEKSFDSWLKPVVLLGRSRQGGSDAVRLGTPSFVRAEYVRNHYTSRLVRAFAAHIPAIRDIIVEVASVEMPEAALMPAVADTSLAPPPR